MKRYKIKICPRCLSHKINVITEDKDVLWVCSCGWKGDKPSNKYLDEDEYIKHSESL